MQKFLLPKETILYRGTIKGIIPFNTYAYFTTSIEEAKEYGTDFTKENETYETQFEKDNRVAKYFTLKLKKDLILGKIEFLNNRVFYKKENVTEPFKKYMEDLDIIYFNIMKTEEDQDNQEKYNFVLKEKTKYMKEFCKINEIDGLFHDNSGDYPDHYEYIIPNIIDISEEIIFCCDKHN